MSFYSEHGSYSEAYSGTDWYDQYYEYLTTGKFPEGADTLTKTAIKNKCQNHRMRGGALQINDRGVWKHCLPQADVAEVLRLAHECEGHWKLKQTLVKLRPYYWPGIAFTHILMIIDYFSRFVRASPTVGKDQEEVIRCLTWLTAIIGICLAAYTDEGGHFAGIKTQNFLKERKDQVDLRTSGGKACIWHG